MSHEPQTSKKSPEDRPICINCPGNPDFAGFSVTDPAHGGKVDCQICHIFIDEGFPYAYVEQKGEGRKYFCRHHRVKARIIELHHAICNAEHWGAGLTIRYEEYQNLIRAYPNLDPIQDNCKYGYVLPDRCRYNSITGCDCGAYPPVQVTAEMIRTVDLNRRPALKAEIDKEQETGV